MDTTIDAPPKRHSYGQVAIAGTAWGYVRLGLNAVVVLPTAVVMARLLSPEEFGIAAAAIFFGQLSKRLTAAGLNAAIVRTKDLRSEHVSTAFIFNLVAGTVVGLALVASAPWLGQFYGNSNVSRLMPVVALTFAVSAIGSVPTSLLARNLLFKQSTTVLSVDLMTTNVTGMVLAWLGFGFWSIAYAELLGGISAAVSASYLARWRPRWHFSVAAFRELSSFGLGTYLRQLFNYLATNVDNLIVGWTLGVSALGYYDKAFSFVNRIILRLSASGPSVSFRIFSLIQDDHARFQRAYQKVLLAVSLLGYPMFTWLILAAPELFRVLLGNKWLPALLPFQILCAAGMLKLVYLFTSSASQAKGWIWAEVGIQLLYVIMIVVGCLIGTRVGVSGVAVAVLCVSLVMSVLMQTILKRATGLRWAELLEPQLPATICATTLGVAVLVAEGITRSRWPTISPLFLLGEKVFVALVAYLVFLRFSWFTEVRILTRETIQDIGPSISRFVRKPRGQLTRASALALIRDNEDSDGRSSQDAFSLAEISLPGRYRRQDSYVEDSRTTEE